MGLKALIKNFIFLVSLSGLNRVSHFRLKGFSSDTFCRSLISN